MLKGQLTSGRVPRRPERHHGEVPLEIRGRRRKSAKWPPSARFSCSRRSSSAATRRSCRSSGARRRSRRLIESGIGAFYLICALMTVASAVIDQRVPHQRLLDQVRRRTTPTASSRCSTRSPAYWGGLDGSIMFWVFLLSVFGSHRGVREPRAPPRADSRTSSPRSATVQMFFLYLMIVHKNPFTTYLTNAPADGEGLNPLLQNYWMVIHPPSLYTGFVGHDDPVRVRHRGARHRPPRRLVAARRPPLDDVQLAVPLVRPHARDDLGVRGARLGRLLGLGSGRERRRCCRGSPRPRSCTR